MEGLTCPEGTSCYVRVCSASLSWDSSVYGSGSWYRPSASHRRWSVSGDPGATPLPGGYTSSRSSSTPSTLGGSVLGVRRGDGAGEQGLRLHRYGVGSPSCVPGPPSKTGVVNRHSGPRQKIHLSEEGRRFLRRGDRPTDRPYVYAPSPSPNDVCPLREEPDLTRLPSCPPSSPRELG